MSKGADNLYPYSIAILVAFSAIDMATHLMLKAETDVMKYLIANTLKIGMYAWLLANWIAGLGIANAIANSFEKMGFIAASITSTDLAPAQIFKNSFTILEQATKMVTNVNGLPATIIAIILFLVILIAILICAAQLFMARVEFWVMAVLTMPLIALGTFKYFRFLFEKTISAVINAGIKIMVVTFIMSIITPMMTDMISNFEKASSFGENLASIFQITFACIVMAIMVLRIPALVQGLLNGSPNLSGEDMTTPLKAASKGYAGATRELARWSAASQMPGGSKAKGSPGLAKSLSKTAGQLKEGQIKGAAGTMLNYGGGKLGTLGNRMKMAAEGAFRDQYYQKMAEVQRTREARKSSQAWSEMYEKQKDNSEYAKAVTDHFDTMTKDGQIKDHVQNAKRRDPITINHDDDKN